MNKKDLVYLFGVLISVIGCLIFPTFVEAESLGLDTNGKVEVKTSNKTEPFDPENPLQPVDPGESPSTEGELRIDFVSAINFADAKITKENRKYPSLAQLFHDETPARASYVQITDLRRGAPGWSLYLKQESQFKQKKTVDLTGAVLSFDDGWANSGGIGKAPNIFKDIISIDQIGSSYQVASADKGAGTGTWLISFGASADNHHGRDNTLKQLKGGDGQALVDDVYHKKMYSNSAINLTVPTYTHIQPGRYQTKLTWVLQATP